MELELPPLLRRMVAEGTWATPGGDVDPRISIETARRWDRVASGIHLENPYPLANDLVHVPELAELWDVTAVDPDRCLVLGDFGPGSDNPIMLDFAKQPPPVRTMQPDGPGSRWPWITIAPTFDAFVVELGLLSNP